MACTQKFQGCFLKMHLDLVQYHNNLFSEKISDEIVGII